METAIHTYAELEVEAGHFVATLRPREIATLVTLSGDLGAGKTAFIKACAHMLGIEEVVTSPTFVLEKIYTLPEGSIYKRLVHIDAYRLEKGSDLTVLGFVELMQDPKNLIFLEWPEMVEDALLAPTHTLTFVVLPDDVRVITYG